MQPRSLHQALNHHQPLSQIKRLDLRSAAFNQRDAKERTPLRSAAQYGRADVLGWLLDNGAEIERVPLEVADDYPIVPQFLAACDNEDRLELKADPVVSAAVLFRAIFRRENRLAERVKKTPELAPLIELAFAKGKPSIAIELLPKNTVPRANSSAPTAGFWAFATKVPEAKQICKTEADWIHTFQQLKRAQKTAACEALLAAAGENIAELCWQTADEVPEEKSEVPEVKSEVPEVKLSVAQRHAYTSAQQNDAKLLQLQQDFLTGEDLLVLFTLAYRNKDFVALHTMCEVFNCADLFKNLLLHDKFECARFLLIGTRLDFYKLMLAWRNEKDVLTKFLQLEIVSLQGLMLGLMARCVMPEIVPTIDVVGLLKFLSKEFKEDLTPIFQQCMTEVSATDKEVVAVANRISLPLPDSKSLSEDVFSHLPKELWKIILDYDGSGIATPIGGISPSFADYIHTPTVVEWNKYCKYLAIERELKLLSDFIAVAGSDVSHSLSRKAQNIILVLLLGALCVYLSQMEINYVVFGSFGVPLGGAFLIGDRFFSCAPKKLREAQQDTRAIATRLFAEYQTVRRNPFNAFTMESNDDQVLTVARTTVQTKTAALQKCLPPPKPVLERTPSGLEYGGLFSPVAPNESKDERKGESKESPAPAAQPAPATQP